MIISYDVTDNRRRTKLAKELENYGMRVQYSVFEGDLDDLKLDEMCKAISGIINESEDGIRIYRLCEKCMKTIRIIGVGEITRDRDFYIV